MKRKIYLEGELGQLFTPELEADVRNVSDAIKLLDANFDGAFRKYLAESDSKGLDFVVEIDKKEKSEKEILESEELGDISFHPVPRGSRSKFTSLVLGVALIGIGLASPQFLAFGNFTNAQVGMALLGIGVSLASASLAMIMAPDPAVDKEQPPTYLFDGSQQNVIEGDPVPLLYGELRVPGRPIGFRTSNLGANTGEYVTPIYGPWNMGHGFGS